VLIPWSESPAAESKFVAETILSNEGRKPVPWQKAFVGEEVKVDEPALPLMQPYFKDIHLAADQTREKYSQQLREIVLSQNPGLRRYPQVVDALVMELSLICEGTKGTVVADDYNFLGDRVNECLTLIQEVRETIHESPAKELKEAEIVEQVIKRGREIR